MEKTTIVKIFIEGMLNMYFILMSAYFFLAAAGRKHENAKSTFKLAAWGMVWLGISLTVPFVVQDLMGRRSVFFDNLFTLFDMMSIPCIGGVMYGVVRSKCTRTIYMAALQLPIAISIAVFCLTQSMWAFWIGVGYTVCYGIIMVLSSFVFIADYQRKLQNTFSNTKKRNLRWMYIFVCALSLQALLWGALDANNNNSVMNISYYVFSMVLWTWFAHQIYTHDFNIQAIDLGLEPFDEDTVEDASLDAWHTYTDMEKAIFVYVVEKRNFTKTDLCISDLVTDLNITRQEADAFFKEFGVSFNEYVNNARTSYAEMLITATDMNDHEIAQKAGFEQTSSMRSHFKKMYDTTPEEYRIINS